MNRRFWVLATALLAAAGCVHPQTRLQSDDEPEKSKDYEVQTIGDATVVANAEPVAVSGVGLVVGLEGTGGGAPPGGFRSIMEKQLKQKGFENYKAILDSPNHSLVLVSALLPAGARKGDPLDIDVTLPPQSRTSSLRGGYLVECIMHNYGTTHGVDPTYDGSDRWLKGHPLARAEGPVLVGFGSGDQADNLKRGRIWGGGRCEIDRPFYLALKDDQQYARVAMRIAERINETFQGSFHRMPGTETAVAKTKSVVVLGVPHQYKHNLPRYLRVARLIPLQQAPAPGSPYLSRLENELMEPGTSVVAALRLEALGPESVPALKRGLHSQHALVRFTSAEALAYLGDPACGEELAKLVEEQPMLRAYSLTAMASLDESICHLKLRDLLASPSAETRYGAFRALRVLEEKERNSPVQGELINDSFWLHRVAPKSPGLVHISSSRRPEIVLFGEMGRLEPPFSFLAGAEYTVTAGQNDERCTISRFSVRHGTRRKQCAMQLEEIIKSLGELGATYPDVVELLRQADRCRCLTCAVKNDALPVATSVQELAHAGAKDGEFLRNEAEILQARSQFNLTPTLYETTATYGIGRRKADGNSTILLRQPPKEEPKPTAQGNGRR